MAQKRGGGINFRGKGLAHLMNSCSFLPLSVFPSLFLCKDEKDEKKNPHTVTIGEVLCGQSITNQSLKVLVLPLEDVLHYLQTFNVVTGGRLLKVCVCVCVSNYSWPSASTFTALPGTSLNLRYGC